MYVVSRKAKAFAPKLAKAVVLTLYLLRDNVQKTVKLFSFIKRLKSTLDMLTLLNLKEETSFKVLLFLTLCLYLYLYFYLLLKLLVQGLCLLLGNIVKCNFASYR